MSRRVYTIVDDCVGFITNIHQKPTDTKILPAESKRHNDSDMARVPHLFKGRLREGGQHTLGVALDEVFLHAQLARCESRVYDSR